MFDHVGIRVKNLDVSVRFYTAALNPLGFELTSKDESSASFGAKGAYSLWLYGGSQSTTPVHLAFTAPNQAAVDSFYREGLKTQGSDNGAPGVRQDYSPNYYAAFLYDPDGNNVEAVYLR